MKKQPKNIMTYLNTNNMLQKRQTRYYDFERQLEQKVQERTAEIVRVAQQLAASNRELRTANQELESFARTLSHDLQEPLRSLSMFTQLLEEEYREKLDEQAQEYFDYITGSATRMQALIRDLLAYSRVGKHEHTRTNIDLNQLVETAIIDLQGIIQETEAEIIVDDLPTVSVNPTEISQLLRNLISNSLKFRSKEKPRIEITSELKKERWSIAIKDNGIGIEPEHHSKIFQVFKRLHSQEQYSGSGVGLSICQKIIERHQGTIEVKSQLGKGSTFSFTLPKALDN